MAKLPAPFKTVHPKDYEPVSVDILKALPDGVVRRQLVIPLAKTNGRLVVGTIPRKENQLKAEGIQLVSNCPVELVLVSPEEIEAFIDLHYPSPSSTLKPIVAEIPEPRAAPQPTKMPTQLEELLRNAVENRAAEIVIERSTNRVYVRQRIRGVLISDRRVHTTAADLTVIVDFLGKLGGWKDENDLRWVETEFEFRPTDQLFSCVFFVNERPTFTSMTIRLYKVCEKPFAPALWGMGPQQAQVLETFLERSQGLLVFCGNDSADVTAIIQACVKQLATPEKHLITVTSRPANWFPGNEELISGGDPDRFTKLLKIAFQHAPDVVVVHPLQRRDQLELSCEEALRGRFVVGRLFAQDAADAMMQMLAMDVEPYLLGSALMGVVVQRTLRLNCQRCQEKDIVPRDRIRDLGIPVAMQPSAFFRGKGCDACMSTGFDREADIFEILEMTDEFRNRLAKGMTSEAFRSAVKANGMMTLRQVAVHKAINGQTSLAEVLRVTL